jgi:hypothetical protein
MAYTDPDTGITRDKYGNEVVRDPSGTDPHAATSYWTWAVGIAVAAVLALMLFNMNTNDNPTVTAPNERPITEPVTPKAPPPTP